MALKNNYLKLILAMLVGCSAGPKYKVEYLPQGENQLMARTYSSNGILESEFYLTKDSLRQGSYTEFYSDGKRKIIGNYHNGDSAAFWHFFREDGSKSKLKYYEYNLFTNKYESKQALFFSENGDTLKESRFIHIRGQDTIQADEKFQFEIKLIGPRYVKNIGGNINILKNFGELKQKGLLPINSRDLTIIYRYPESLLPGDYILYGVIYDVREDKSSEQPIGDTLFFKRPLVVR